MKATKVNSPAKSNPLMKSKMVKHFLRDWQLHLLILLPILYMFLFHYAPMYGAQIAFRDYRTKGGLTGSEWVGLKHFVKFLTSSRCTEIIYNTLAISLYQICVGFPLPVFFALMINTVRQERFKKFVQNIAYMPHFISTVVLVSIVDMVLSPINGIYGTVYRTITGEFSYPTDFRPIASSFRHLYVWSGIWQTLGWSTIVYTAALSGVSQELHEAAMLDGASRWKRVLHIDFPSILPTVCTMLIMRFGSIMGVGFEKVYLMQTDLNMSTSEVISTYVYKQGMQKANNYSYASAIGLFNSVINASMLILVNWITKKLSDGDYGLF